MPPLGCRLRGHRWEFGVDGSDVVWTCTRCHEAGGRRGYADRSEARYHAAYFNRGRPKPPGPFLAAFGGLLPRTRPGASGGERPRADNESAAGSPADERDEER